MAKPVFCSFRGGSTVPDGVLGPLLPAARNEELGGRFAGTEELAARCKGEDEDGGDAADTFTLDVDACGMSTGIGTVGISVTSGRWLKMQPGRLQVDFSGHGND